MARSSVSPRRVARQATALLMAADGVANEQIARCCAVDSDTVRRWRRRFELRGPSAVGVVAPGRGRRPSLSPGTVAEVLRLTEHERPPSGATRWSTRSMAARVGIGKDAVARIWADHALGSPKVKPLAEYAAAENGVGSRAKPSAMALQLALLRGDVREIRWLVDDELADQRASSSRRADLVAARSFAHILESEFATAYDEAYAGIGLGCEQLRFRALCALSSGMGGLERAGPDLVSVESTATAILSLSDGDLLTQRWAAAITAEAAMSVGRLDLAETVAGRLWRASAATNPPEAVFAGQTLVRALLFQGRLAEVCALAPHVEAAAQSYGLLALRLVVRGSLAYVDALSGRHAALTRHATDIDELAAHCPQSYFVAGALVLTAYALAATQHARQAASVLLRGAGGQQLPNIQLVDRAYGFELLVTAALSLNDLSTAREWGELAAGLTGLPPDGMASAAVQRIHARLAVADGEAAGAAVLADQAATIAAGNAGHLDATRARLLAGSALLFDTEHNWSARLALSTASEQATLLGATSLALLARRDLRSIGLRLIGEPQAPMTRRERQVAELLLAGASNAAIATALGVSPRTVQSHVSRVLKSLDLPSRVGVPHLLNDNQEPCYAARQLTRRQRDVADLISRGYTNAGAARTLNVSVKTIEKHLGDIYQRLGIDSRTALADHWTR